MKTAYWLVLLVTVLASASTHAADCPTETTGETWPKVHYDPERNRLGVQAERVGLNSLLAAITEATGIEFINDDADDCEPLDLHFDDLPLNKALAQLLRDRSYVVRESVAGILTVWLLPTGNGERMLDTNVEHEQFYDGLQGNAAINELADQVREMESGSFGSVDIDELVDKLESQSP